MYISKLIKNNKWFICAIAFICIVCLLNVFPQDYVIAGGDVFQVLNFNKFFYQYSHVWADIGGEGFFLQSYTYLLYYMFIYLISIVLNLSLSSQSVLYYFIFLAGSFISFYYCLPLFTDEKKPGGWKVLFSLLYSFNLFTYQNFFSTLGFSPFNFLYILLPVLFALTYKYFTTSKIRLNLLAALGLIFFVSNIVNGNLPFFIALVLFLTLFIFSIFVFYYRFSEFKSFINKFILFIIIYFLSVCWSVVPQVIEMLRLVSAYQADNIVFGLQDWIVWQAVRFPSPFFITFDINSSLNNLIYHYSKQMLFLLTLFSFLLIKEYKKLSVLFFMLLIIAIFLLNKGIDVLPVNIITGIFSNPILGSMRSHEKIIIFLPFFMLITLYLNLDSKIKYHKYLLCLLIASSVIITTPLLLGKMQKESSASYKKNENYQTAEYSYLNKIPQDYYHVAQYLNNIKSDQKIIRIPYTVINSPNWVNLPAWRHVGSDPTLQLFDNATIQMSQYGAFGKWNYGELWSKQKKEESSWILSFAGLLNANYLIYQKDADERFLKTSQEKIRFYEEKKYISNVYKGNVIDLYRINPKYNLPHIYTPSNIIISDENVNIIPQLIGSSKWKDKTAIFLTNQNKNKVIHTSHFNKDITIDYKKVDPTRYRIIFKNVQSEFVFVFSELFHGGWKLYPVSYSSHKSTLNKFKGTSYNYDISNGAIWDTWFKKSVSEDDHFLANGYANAWRINPGEICSMQSFLCQKDKNGNYSIEVIIDFYPQHLFLICYIISGFTLLSCIIYLIISKFKKRK